MPITKGVTWAVLTSFEHLQVFDAQTGHPFLNLSYKDYVQDFDRLWFLSRESMETGADLPPENSSTLN